MIQINYIFWQRFICLLAIIYLSQPFLAELYAKQANTMMIGRDVESAVRYFELARRLTPYNSEYYYQEAQYWYLAVQHANNNHAAARADQLFQRGLDANPFAIKNLLARAVLNRDHSESLEKPATREEILGWFDYILYWRPSMEVAQYEYVKTLIKFEKQLQAAIKLEEFLMINPDSTLLHNLASSIYNQ